MKGWISYKVNLKVLHAGLLLTLLILSFSLSACSGPTFPTGSFSMKSDDIYFVEFSDDGNWTFYVFGTVISSGTYSIQGDEFTFETDSFCDAEDSGKATYIWTWEDGNLTFILKGEDHCEGRRGVLDNVAYVKEPDVEPTQQEDNEEADENDLSAVEVIIPKNADQVTEIDHINTGTVFSVAFSPDGLLLVTGGYQVVKLWDAETKEALNTLEGHKHSVLCLAISPDGRLLASGGWEDSTVRLWDTVSGEDIRTLEAPMNCVNSVAFSPDNRFLAVGSIHNNSLRLWDLENGSQSDMLEVDTFGISSVAFSPDGQVLAAGGYNGVGLWDAFNGELLHKLDAHTNSVAFSPNGTLLATGGADGIVFLWDVENGKQLGTLEGYYVAISTVEFSPDGRLLAAGGDNGIVLWGTDSRAILKTLYGYTPDEPTNKYAPDVSSLAFSPDGRVLVSGGIDGTVLWGIP